MKNIFNIIKLNISKRVFKKMFGVLILLGLGTLLFSQSNVYAQNTVVNTETTKTAEEQQTEKIIDISEVFNFVLKLIYALLWPVLFIVGGALDNGRVYGSFLHLDASLWSLRNIMKNFANFALGFMVLFAIVKNIFSIGGDDGKWKPIEIIKKTLIAGVLIQMSWFLMAAVIDISTILTYSIGGLPMTILQNNPEYKNIPVLGINANLDMNDDSNNDKMKLNYYNTYGDKKISLCRVEKIIGHSGQYIVGRENVAIDTGTFFEEGICSWSAWPYKYKEYLSGYEVKNNDYKIKLDYYLSAIDTGEANENILDCSFLAVDFSKPLTGCAGFGSLDKTDQFFKDDNGEYSVTIDNLLEKSKGFVGPFITIYSSILDFSALTADPSGGSGLLSNLFELFIKFLFAVALFFPLIALAVVLIARIGILWLAIVISPILALLTVFGEALGFKFDGMFETFTLPNLIKLIFAPVFVVFAIGMSLIFLTALKPNTQPDKTNVGLGQEQLESMGVTLNDNTYSVLGLVDIELDQDGIGKINNGMDTFAWLITNLFSVGIIWFFLFFAVKMTKIGEKIGGNIQTSMQKLIGNLPIIPIGGGKSVGLSVAGTGLSGLGKNISNTLTAQQTKDLQKQMPWLYGDLESDSTKDKGSDVLGKINSTLRTNVIGQFSKGTSADDVWKNLDDTQKENFATHGITDAVGLAASYNYFTNNHTEFVNKTGVEEKNITTYDAEKYSIGTIENMVNNKEGNWKEWAKGVLGGNVKTATGTYVMVNVGTHANPSFKLLSQEDYSKNYLGQKDDKYNQEESNKNIKEKIEAQYKKQYGDITQMESEAKKEMEEHIAAQQKEIADRIKNIEEEKQTNGSTPTTPTTQE